MDISSAAAASSAHAQATVQAEASVKVLKKALDLQGQTVLGLLEALPAPPMPTAPPAPAVGSARGGVVDTWA